MGALFTAKDGKQRCNWCNATDDYMAYHDHEWGFPVIDDIHLFEKVCLEGFQAGLSWRTILTKRENFRAAFCGFDFHKLATFTEKDVERLLQDAGIIRHRGKIEAAIHNAKRACALQEKESSLAAFFWRYAPKTPAKDNGVVVPATSPESVQLSKDLKKMGWKFVGPTTMYAFMQSMGMVNDHMEGCFARPMAENAARPDAA